MADTVAAVFRQPFAEQVAAFRLRLGNLVPTATWQDLWKDGHDTGFMVAGAMKADLLADLAAAVDRSISEGQTLEAFRRDFRAIVEKHGWHGWTGEGSKRGEAWRTRVIYRTNMSVSYAAGRWSQLMKDGFGLLVYRHSGAEHPRLDHLAWDRLVLPVDHPFWVQHYPPNGWGCGCKVYGARSERGAARVGGDPSKRLPDGWDAVDPKTGEQRGVGKGWGYAPGRSVERTIRAMTEKALRWDYSLATAYMRSLPDDVRDAFSTGYRDLPGLATDVRRWVERVRGERDDAPIDPRVQVEPQRTLGLATLSQKRALEDLTGADLADDLYDYTIDPMTIRHIFRRHATAEVETSRGQRPVTAEDVGRVAALINSPDQVATAGTSPGRGAMIRYEKGFAEGRLVAIFELRPGRRRLALATMWVER
ncbi:PBECR3 domain-containing polyvalent protein [Frigidibacter oleivorans]|uniref:PBECR3 domain-containing polyvalent protein n=1 Tax=Frigidibacter oleivorans TaxID=2487129 RepID=UPI000F8D073C|nr:phage minor head protein [Frigidibacter oleivorans]